MTCFVPFPSSEAFVSSRHKVLSRRTLLRGLGSVAIALPFMEEMGLSHALAAPAPPPQRMVTAFFGLGLDPSWQRNFSSALEPYEGLADKMAMFSVSLDQGSLGGAHCNTATVVFVGEKADSTNVAGGASIDQIMRKALDPNAATLSSGLWFRRGACDAQALRVYNADGSSRSPIKRPSQVFETLFGGVKPPPITGTQPDPEEVRQRHQRRSVLDTVIAQYSHYKGDRSPLGAASKQKLDQHLSAIREIEARLAPADAIAGGDTPPTGAGACVVPSKPGDPPVVDYDKFTFGTGEGAPELTFQDFQKVYRLHADLWVQALRCDLVRYGNLAFESAGGHTNLSGTYKALGRSTTFPGTSQHDTYFHGNQLPEAELYQHFAQSNIAYFLEQLDAADHLEENGKTVLDNSCVVIGTEYGWNHSKEDVFHAVAGGGGRFKSGFFTDRKFNGIDLYNAILKGYGVTAAIGSTTGVASQGDGSVLLA